jgi:TRAP-type C4-dicarboxylate transport system substrate-binding protein
MLRALAVLLVTLPLSARAENEIVVRMAAVAPEGTAWAHELRAVSDEVDRATEGRVKVKWYFGGITGDDVQSGERIRRGQLDGVASGGMLCMRLAPSMRVLRSLGLFQSREESAYVMGRLKPVLDKEFQAKGFTNLVEVGLGADVLFTRDAVRSLADLRKQRLWIWDLDEVLALELPVLGVHGVPWPLSDARAGFESGKYEGFIGLPTAALAFQWATLVNHVTDLRLGFLSGCLIVASRTFDALPIEGQNAFRHAAAKLQARVEDVGREQDRALLSGLFARQGMKADPVDATFRAEFFAAARQARERLGEKLVPASLLHSVEGMLADFRGERGDRELRQRERRAEQAARDQRQRHQ